MDKWTLIALAGLFSAGEWSQSSQVAGSSVDLNQVLKVQDKIQFDICFDHLLIESL